MVVGLLFSLATHDKMKSCMVTVLCTLLEIGISC